MRVVLLGYHEMGCAAYRSLRAAGQDIVAVFSYEDSAEENCWFSSLSALAEADGVPVFFTRSINASPWPERIAALQPDLILSAHYRDMVRRKVRKIPRLGAVNLHASLLPKYRGRCPLNWQLVQGETESGVTLHRMVAKADAGAIIDQQGVPVGPDDNALELYKKLLGAAETVLTRSLPSLAAGAPGQAQDAGQATLFGGRCPEDGRIDWRLPAGRIHNLVRAVAPPWPGAFCDSPQGRLQVNRSRLAAAQERKSLEPGEVHSEDGLVLVGTASEPLELLEYCLPDTLELEHGTVLPSEGSRALEH